MTAPLVPLSGVELRGLIQARDILSGQPDYMIGVTEALAAVRSILKRGAMYADDWAEAGPQPYPG